MKRALLLVAVIALVTLGVTAAQASFALPHFAWPNDEDLVRIRTTEAGQTGSAWTVAHGLTAGNSVPPSSSPIRMLCVEPEDRPAFGNPQETDSDHYGFAGDLPSIGNSGLMCQAMVREGGDVPEPCTLVLLGSLLLGSAGLFWRRRMH